MTFKVEWDDARRDRIRTMHAENLSHAQIADILTAEWGFSVTKDMVANQSHRMKLQPRDLGAPTARLLAYLRERAAQGLAAPTNDEICGAIKLASGSAGPRVLQLLERAGEIKLSYSSRNSRTIEAADGSWRMHSTAPARPHALPARPKPAPKPRIEAPPKPPRQMVVVVPDDADEVAEHVMQQRVAHLREQIASRTRRATGPRHRQCQFPMWPNTAPTPRVPGPFDPPQFGPALFCGEPVALSCFCLRHAAVCFRERGGERAI